MPVPLNTMTPDSLALRSVERLRNTQERLDLSYREMATRMGVHRNTYLNWLKGRTPVPPMALMALDTMLAEAKRAPKAK
jgi:transcriptional regulator with XRE-family HTH domain